MRATLAISGLNKRAADAMQCYHFKLRKNNFQIWRSNVLKKKLNISCQTWQYVSANTLKSCSYNETKKNKIKRSSHLKLEKKLAGKLCAITENWRKADVWNSKKKRWTKVAIQTGHKALTVRGFVDMKKKTRDSSDFKSCIKFVVRCEDRRK